MSRTIPEIVRQAEAGTDEATGRIQMLVAGDHQTTVGAAGGASALPATPLGYMKVELETGTTVVIPYYNAA